MLASAPRLKQSFKKRIEKSQQVCDKVAKFSYKIFKLKQLKQKIEENKNYRAELERKIIEIIDMVQNVMWFYKK